MDSLPELHRIFHKLRFMSETFDEIDRWMHAEETPSGDSVGTDVPSLLQTLLSKRRITLEDIEELRMREGEQDLPDGGDQRAS